MSDFNEQSRDGREPHGGGWRRLDPPVTVRAYIAQAWHDLVAVDFNDETRELRVEMPPVIDGNGVDLISHRVLNPAMYEADPAALR